MRHQLLINQEDFLLRRHVKKLLEQTVDPAMKDFNLYELSAKDTNGAALIDSLQMQPIMADRRVVIVQDFSHYGKEDVELLTKYFHNPNPHSLCILIADKIDKRTSFYKTFFQVGEVIEFKTPYDNQIPHFIVGEAQTLGLTVSLPVASLIFELVGSDLATLVSELEKSLLYLHPETKAMPQHVEALIGFGVANVFAFTDALAGRDYSKATGLFLRLCEQGEAVNKIVALLIRHYKKLLLTSCGVKKGFSPDELSRVLGVHPYFLKQYLGQVRTYTEANLKHIYARLLDLSWDLRSSGTRPETQLAMIIQEICLGIFYNH